VSLLLDTHVVLWWLSADERLPDESKDRLNDAPDVWVSAVTIWEAGIKQSIGKLDAPRALPETIAQGGFRRSPSPSTMRSRPGVSPFCTAIRSTACSSRRPVARG
jgi:hypothetical protein